jgi:tripartite-type tricarboxylate transporter receptor subunit TctC
VVVENKGGANGNLGEEMVARSSPDGYTLLMSSGSMVAINPYLYVKMPFDPANDLVPVASVARVPFYLVVRTENPAPDFKAFVTDLKPTLENAISDRPESAALRILRRKCSRR